MNSVSGYKIGDTGLGGGKVFYDKGNNSGGWRYLEVASENMTTETTHWGSGIAKISGTKTAVGTGKKNTYLILEKDPYASAAKACVNYRGGGKDDWFLPSKDELNELYKVRDIVGITPSDFFHFEYSEDFQALDCFWSSSQGEREKNAWIQSFKCGSQETIYILHCIYVRAIRAF